MMAEAEDIARAANWRSIALAFVLWTAHFFAVYGTALLLPESPLVRWIVPVITVAALSILWLWWRRLPDRRSRIANLALAMSGLAVLFQTLPALIG